MAGQHWYDAAPVLHVPKLLLCSFGLASDFGIRFTRKYASCIADNL